MRNSFQFLILAVLLIASAAVLLPSNAADAPVEPITLEIPQFQLQVDPEGAVVIPNAGVDQLIVHVGKRPGQVNPGSIFTKLNTDASNMIMTTSAMADGVLCRLDLNHREGFRLHKGRNSFEVSFTDSMQRVHYASFLIQTQDAVPADNKRISIKPDKVPAADKYAVIVGIARYADTAGGITSLQFADRDAKDFHDFLLSPDGGSFPKDHIKILR